MDRQANENACAAPARVSNFPAVSLLDYPAHGETNVLTVDHSGNAVVKTLTLSLDARGNLMGAKQTI